MEHLPASALRSLLAFLEEVSAAALDPFPERVLAALERLIPGHILGYNVVRLPGAHLSAVVRPVDAVPDELLPVFDRHVGEHPTVIHYRRTGDGHARTLSDFLSQRQFHRLGLYNEFYRPLRTEHLITVTLPAPAGVLLGLSVARERHDFSERERVLLDLAWPHVVAAHRTAELLSLLQRGMAEEGVEMVLLEKSGRVRLASDQARARIAEAFGPFWCRGERLPELVEHWVREQRQRFHGDDMPRPATPLFAEGRDGNIVVRFVTGGVAAEHDLLLIEKRRSAPDPATLIGLGLGRREAEVLAWVARGKTNAEVGRQLSIAEGTVERHLERIFRKLDVGTRTAAAARAFEVWSRDSDPQCC